MSDFGWTILIALLAIFLSCLPNNVIIFGGIGCFLYCFCEMKNNNNKLPNIKGKIDSIMTKKKEDK